MGVDFSGLSRNSLQDAKLARLNRLANLRKASRQHRDALGQIRSEMAAANHEIEIIEQQLKHMVQFPTATSSPGEVGKPFEVRKRA